MTTGQNISRVPEKARELSALTALFIYPESAFAAGGVTYALGRRGRVKKLIVASDPGREESLADYEGETAGRRQLRICPLSAGNAARLRRALPFLAPAPGGCRTSVGCGDRLGLATPGHIRALGDSGVFPYLAQQSIREMARTGRTPRQVMDDALWGVFQAGWTGGFGADADHLKTEADVRACADAGFVLFTIDPGDHVDNGADRLTGGELASRAAVLRFDAWRPDQAKLKREYLGRTVDLGGVRLSFTEETLWRALVKYGGAIAHTVGMYGRIRQAVGQRPFEVEMSVDETDSPTSPEEHYFVAAQLREAGVEWVSLAPRFTGRFEKGVDYIGDLAIFEKTLIAHRAVAEKMGDYKLSIHSGSDKFTIYPVIARTTANRVHLKTAGTSYLEGLRAIAGADPGLFREIYHFARGRYETDRASYHVSASLERVPPVEALDDQALGQALDQFDARQVFHVTFGSVLTTLDESGAPLFRDRILEVLAENEEAHYRLLAGHLGRHVKPFAG